MLVSVLMDKEADFKSMLAFYEHFVDRDYWSDVMEHLRNRNSTRQLKSPIRILPTDGDLDAAYALLLAGEPQSP